ncbi:hypothetical protein [Aidingimonas halophila]|uniref:Phage abortive infection protein n=1 Tax=Aidingimonas halophila TaxID=574349 RepID=A0A1H2SVM0_9GAMM|nr:hypothetical protein [Aidingimonas halophila]GHC17065.1 hypothetical protein GCM10008094_03070 [Aidingimonas halophila]SDW35567.1 hypothetical protein SAMN05443545_101667 [Aidingimonas halophila]
MTRWLILVGGVATLLVGGLWFWLFEGSQLGELTSHEVESFAIYFGGIMTPFIAFLSLVAFLRTLHQQQEQIEELRRQARKSELRRMIEQVDHDFESHMKSIVIDAPQLGDNITAHEIISNILIPKWHWERVLLEKWELEKDAVENVQEPDMHLIWLFHGFGVGAGHLNQLRLYVKEHDDIVSNNMMTKYYARKHNVAFERFKERGWLTETL